MPSSQTQTKEQNKKHVPFLVLLGMSKSIGRAKRPTKHMMRHIMNIDEATQDAEALGEETPDMETLEESLIELTQRLGCEETVEQYLNENDETTEEDNQTSEEEELFDAKSFSLDTTLVRVRMKERNLALTDLQEQLGVAYRTLTRWLSKDDFPQHRNLVKLANVLDIEPYQLVYRKKIYGDNRPSESSDALRYVQRRIETIVTQILDDKEISKEKKLDALVKYHNILLKATK